MRRKFFEGGVWLTLQFSLEVPEASGLVRELVTEEDGLVFEQRGTFQ